LIVPAFKLEGKQYYKFDDPFNISARGFAAIDIYSEVEMRCSRQFLKAHNTAMESMLTKAINGLKVKDNRIDFVEVADNLIKAKQLNQHVKERLDMLFTQDTVYKLASVVFFTEDEDANDYDFKYNIEQKIPVFKRAGGAFFLNTPLQDLMPFGSLSESDLRDYMMVEMKIASQQLAEVSSLLSESDKSSEWFKELTSLMNLDIPKAK
jgi:hypothetical protein